MSFTNYIFNYHKKLNSIPALSTRLLANVIDMFIALIILSPIYSMISTLIFGADSFAAQFPEYSSDMQNSFAKLSDEEKQQFIKNILNQFYQNNGVIKIILNQFIQIIMVIILAFICWIYFQTTPGKYILGLKIVDQDTLQKPTTKQFIIRAVSVLLSVITLGIGYFVLVFDKKKRAWHDRLARTMVINPKKYLPDSGIPSK